MNAAMPDPDKPNLGVGVAGEQSLGGSKRLVGYFEFSGIDVNGDDPADVARFNLRAHALVVDRGSETSVFLFG